MSEKWYLDFDRLDEPLVWDTDLTNTQLAWGVSTDLDVYWVMPGKVSTHLLKLDGQPMYALSCTNYNNDWDWRVVAFWKMALPTFWRVVLHEPGWMHLMRPEETTP